MTSPLQRLASTAHARRLSTSGAVLGRQVAGRLALSLTKCRGALGCCINTAAVSNPLLVCHCSLNIRHARYAARRRPCYCHKGAETASVLGVGTVKHIFAQCSEVDDSVINAAKQSESIDREFGFYEFFSFVKYNELYDFFSVEKKFVKNS